MPLPFKQQVQRVQQQRLSCRVLVRRQAPETAMIVRQQVGPVTS
jgi:hypothetical protein